MKHLFMSITLLLASLTLSSGASHATTIDRVRVAAAPKTESLGTPVFFALLGGNLSGLGPVSVVTDPGANPGTLVTANGGGLVTSLAILATPIVPAPLLAGTLLDQSIDDATDTWTGLFNNDPGTTLAASYGDYLYVTLTSISDITASSAGIFSASSLTVQGASPVPVPSAILFMASGLGALRLLRRQKQG